ncbi:hypothetical protein PIB30_091081 [Stylosanthes scabra]|uniref:Putative plant transposon protein domain-containing protein n=1 Tax=Stylosanthes scabra TaxID=79078 RepID=A0ABU6WX99_9FABA|nr:hypothetical protein [Stylosanthes scabra]
MEFRTGRESSRRASVKWHRCRGIENMHFLSETGNVAIKDVHQGLSGQMLEGTCSYNQRYTPWNPPPYQHHAPQYNAHQFNGFGDAYYGYEDPLPPYPPSQRNIEGILQVLLQERKEIQEAQKRIEAQLAILTELVTRLITLSVSKDVENLNPKEVHECLQEVKEENVDQEVADEDKELKGMEILQSASSEATPPESPSKLHFEWVNLSDMNLLGPQHYGLLETDAQLRVLCGVLDKKEMDSLGMDESRFITCGESKLKAYNGHLHKLYNNRAKLHKQLLDSARVACATPSVAHAANTMATREVHVEIELRAQLQVIASKGKAPAKASSTRVHGSTSQQQPPLEIQLYETPAHEERGKILEERRALHERTIKFPKGEDTFEERILTRGWGFMYEPIIPINLSWVREFYANKTKKDQREIFLRGRKITCSGSTIEKTLGIPKFRGKCGYSEISKAYNNKTLDMDEVLQVIGKEGATWWEDSRNPVIPTNPKKKILNYEAWMWLKLVVCNINPTRHETTLSMEIVLLIYVLMRDMPVCLASVMNSDPTKTKTHLLIFPMFITKWARDNNVPRFPGDVIVKIPKSQQSLLHCTPVPTVITDG